MRDGGKEVKLFTSALKAFQCNNRIRKQLDDILRGRIIGRMECGRTQLEVFEELGIAQSVISRLWQRFQDDVLSPSLAIIRTQPTAPYGGTDDIRQRFRETRDKYYFIFSFNV
ncbi:HTH_Tnp_Tc3_2 domain-containing protein [Trichonephila clavipes]|nr:HTH_Tnp_Tc3_2 domain-containing protein [Trichonephila clavipes]